VSYEEIWKKATKEVARERDQYKAENEKLKEEVEHLKGIIQDEEDWKLLESEEEWL
jgi:hypothetical protein